MKLRTLLPLLLLAAPAVAAPNGIYVNTPFQNQQLTYQQEMIAQLREQNAALKTVQEQQSKQLETLEKILQYQAAQLQVIKQQHQEIMARE